MNTTVIKNYNFPTTFSGKSSVLLNQLSCLYREIFKIFGIDQEIEPTNESREYTSSGGWFSFPCTETKITYQYANTIYWIIYSSMFNGHIGDLEEDIKANFEQGSKKFELFVNLYTLSYKMDFQSENIIDPQLEQVGTLLQKEFNLSVDLEQN